jgi:hypothetical protein
VKGPFIATAEIAAPFEFDNKPYTIATSTVVTTAANTLVAHWKLDEGEGEIAADSSRNDLEATLVGEPQWLPSGGKFGGALKFDGVDDFVETNYATDLPAWTVSVWVNSPAAPAKAVPSGPVHRDRNFHFNWNHTDDNFRGTAGLMAGGTWYPASFGELQADMWYHLVATYDGNEFKAYKNGVLITTNSEPSGEPESDSTTLKLGRHSRYSDHFAGIIDDVRIYNYALSQVEIAELHAGRELGKGGNPAVVLVIAVIAAGAAGLVIYKMKAAA